MQLVDQEYWKSVQHSAQGRSSWSLANRGQIYDRQGRILAVDQLSWKVGFDPYSASRAREGLTDGNGILSGLEHSIQKTLLLPGLKLKANAGEVARQIRETARSNEEIQLRNKQLSKEDRILPKQYIYIGTVKAGRDEIEFLQAKAELHRIVGRPIIPGLEPIVTREYPYGDLGNLVIGELRGDRKIGLHGVELEYNDLLLERRGLKRQSTDMVGHPIEEATHSVPTIHGSDIHLTLDIQEQSVLEAVLADTHSRTRARSVTGIIMDPKNGEILAMSTYPGLVRGELQKLYNEKRESVAFKKMQRSMLLSMEPGSIVKPLILAAALESGMKLVDPVDVRSISQTFSGKSRRFTDSHLLRDRTLRGSVVESSNIGIVDIGIKLGVTRVHQILNRFGLGSPTGIDLGREELGLLKPKRIWSWYTLSSASFGYEVQVTPIQMIRAYCAIANGGELVTPHFRLREESFGNPHRGARVISESVASSAREVLRSVVLEGTAKRVRGTVGLAGKTGTAKVAAKGGYTESDYISSFIGFAPWEAPERISMVVVEGPATENFLYYASKSAAPAVKEILEAVLHSPENRVQERLEEVLEISVGLASNERAPVPHLDRPVRADSLVGSRSDRQGEGEPGQWNHGEGN